MWGNLCNSGRVPGAGRSMAKAIGVTEASFRDPLRGRVMNTTASHAPKSNAPQLSGLQHDGHGDTDRNATIVERVSQAFQKRIGTERYGVWFGDSVTISVVRLSLILAEVSPELLDTVARNGQADEDCLLVGIGSAAGHEWLRKTFRADFEAAAQEAYGRVVRVVWQTVTPLPSQATGLVPSTEPSGGASIAPAKNKIGKKSPQQTAAKNIPTGLAAQPVTGTGIIGKRIVPGLDAFVVGPSNRMAFAAVELACARPGEISPLLLHGASGVGKTHLIEAMCAHIRQMHPGISVLFLSAEQFTTSFLQALHGSGLPGFRRTCRSTDLLVIDDIQFFVGKRATIMELQHTVDALHRHGKQMVFACDCESEALDGLGPDLVTRLKGGMHARILPADYEVRRGIVAAIAIRRGLLIPDDVVHFIATRMTRHARELAGAVNRLEATSHMLGLPITSAMAEESLSDLVRSNTRSVRLADIERAVCDTFGIDSGSLQSSRRAKTVNHPRMLAMYLARKHTPSALTEIGSYFGRRSHSTVISAQKTVGDWVSQRSQIVIANSKWDVEEAIRRVEDVLRAG